MLGRVHTLLDFMNNTRQGLFSFILSRVILHFESCVLSMVSYYLGKCICTLIILLSLESSRYLLEMVPTIHNKMVEVAGSSLVNSLKDNFSVISISITCKSRSMHILIKSISQSLDFCINNARGHSYHGLKIGIVKE